MHTLPALPYAFDALEPHIDSQTMQIHHGKHHQVYVDNLNKAIQSAPELENLSLEELLRGIDRVPESVRTAVRNHGGGHANHSLFWEIMGPDGGGVPTGELAGAIEQTFGSFPSFQERLTNAALGQFGSGWGWLVLSEGRLEVLARPNQDSPWMEAKQPILGVDVWEHAYYLRYQNRRADYLKAWWNVVRWDRVAERYARARG